MNSRTTSLAAKVFRIISFCAFLPSFALSGGCGMPSLLITPVSNSYALEEIAVQPAPNGKWFPDKIAMIEVEGMLVNARQPGLLNPGENKLSLFTQQLERAELDPKVKAVVLRINSPGGTVTCSDTMYEAILRFKERSKKPVISATQEVAASGAYYLACASDQIVANPTSVIGSIGVIFQTINFSGAMEKLGVSSEAIKSGQFKDMGSPFRPMVPADRKLMQSMVDSYYARFRAVVTKNRKLPTDQVDSITDGRVFTGEQALASGLVDKLGLLEDAIAVARDAAKSPNASVVMYKRPYGYNGSIYANSEAPIPQANVLHLDLPQALTPLPQGFYYLWQD